MNMQQIPKWNFTIKFTQTGINLYKKVFWKKELKWKNSDMFSLCITGKA